MNCTECGAPIEKHQSDVARNKTGKFYCGDCSQVVKGRRPRTGVELTCPQCGNPFYRRPSEVDLAASGRAACCSVPCAATYWRTQEDPRPDVPFVLTGTCARCGDNFDYPRSQSRRFCSAACAGVVNTKIDLHCEWCSAVYVGRPQEGRRFCSRPCFYAHQTATAQGSVDAKGYRLISVNGTQTPEHRHVMAQTLGHELPPGSTVHHRNGDKLDNRPTNLELWGDNHPKGQRALELLDYAREILALFGPDEETLRSLEK